MVSVTSFVELLLDMVSVPLSYEERGIRTDRKDGETMNHLEIPHILFLDIHK